MGFYVENFIYFSPSLKTEIFFEHKLKVLVSVDFMGEVTHFLGIKFFWQREHNEHIIVHFAQEACTDHLNDASELNDVAIVAISYISDFPVDAISITQTTSSIQSKLCHQMQTLVSSLLWVSVATHVDLATITTILSQYTYHPSFNNICAAK